VPVVCAQQAHATQDVFEVTAAANTAAWILADLPVDDAEAIQSAGRYKSVLAGWAEKGWISATTKNRCWELLLTWLEALRDGRALTAGEQKLLDKLREAMTPDAFEHGRADALDVFVRSLT
jgi:hypothetical protein